MAFASSQLDFGVHFAANVNDAWLGHLASAALCEAMQVPVVPFRETQALGQFSYHFNYWGPTGCNRDTHILVRKLPELKW